MRTAVLFIVLVWETVIACAILYLSLGYARKATIGVLGAAISVALLLTLWSVPIMRFRGKNINPALLIAWRIILSLPFLGVLCAIVFHGHAQQFYVDKIQSWFMTP